MATESLSVGVDSLLEGLLLVGVMDSPAVAVSAMRGAVDSPVLLVSAFSVGVAGASALADSLVLAVLA